VKGMHISTIFPVELSNAIVNHHRHITSDALKYIVTVPQSVGVSFYEVFQSQMKSSAGVDGYLVTVVDVS
ncbi:hypothetical protein H5202_23895, partial [Shewanella sp. SG41-4]|uniref:hypothetical protein n=1 Tax=Shewanella sp. SG41-4 TaxID=2760976 RepID=UPI0015FF0DB5